MIKNRTALMKNIGLEEKNRRNYLLDIAEHVLQETKSYELLQKIVRPRIFMGFKKIYVIGIGKAADTMVDAVCKLLPRKPTKIFLANEGHPLPTKDGIKNTQKIMNLRGKLGKRDLVIVMMSGGGSAMFVSPSKSVKLTEKIRLTRDLLKSGATINEINVVRKHLSEVKGGRLAETLYPARVFGFVISDVVGNDLSTIASGPLSPDPSSIEEAVGILEKYKIPNSQKIKNSMTESPKPREKWFEDVSLTIIADHGTVLEKAYAQAKKIGLRVNAVKQPLTGEARDIAREFIKQGKKNTLTIACGETTVTCIGKGHGGRNQEFVLAAMKYLKPNQTILSLGTDGVDGMCPEAIAGAIGDSETVIAARKHHLNLDDFLKRNDSYTFFKKTGGLIKTGPTGTNLGDLVMLLSEA